MISLSEWEEREIETLCKIAFANGAILSPGELVLLTSFDISEREIVTFLAVDPRLSSKFRLESGYIFERPPRTSADEHEEEENAARQAQHAIEEEQRNRIRAYSNLHVAAGFASLLNNKTIMTAVGGTNSYLSARENDDIDFFCITKADKMWIFMLRSFLLARIFKLAGRSRSPLCFSFIMDERWAKRELSRPQDAILARDVLASYLVSGRGIYRQLLELAPWMGAYFPKLYKQRLVETARSSEREPGHDPAQWEGGEEKGKDRMERRETGVASSLLNMFLYRTVGSYVLLKAWLLNRRFRKAGRTESIFTTLMGPDHLIYESRRYMKLRGMYNNLGAYNKRVGIFDKS